MIDKRLQHKAIKYVNKDNRIDIIEFLRFKGFNIGFAGFGDGEFILTSGGEISTCSYLPEGYNLITLDQAKELVSEENQQDNTVITIESLKARRDELKNKRDELKESMDAIDRVIKDLKR